MRTNFLAECDYAYGYGQALRKTEGRVGTSRQGLLDN